jgi:uncharacterized membrane protein YuzA (DUF378 family)
MHRYTPLDWITWGLATAGALNWGLKAVADFNLVHTLAGRTPLVERMIYGLVGFAGVWSLIRYVEYTSTMRPMERVAERIGLGR